MFHVEHWRGGQLAMRFHVEHCSRWAAGRYTSMPVFHVEHWRQVSRETQWPCGFRAGLPVGIQCEGDPSAPMPVSLRHFATRLVCYPTITL